jgi:hypothetical protein
MKANDMLAMGTPGSHEVNIDSIIERLLEVRGYDRRM